MADKVLADCSRIEKQLTLIELNLINLDSCGNEAPSDSKDSNTTTTNNSNTNEPSSDTNDSLDSSTSNDSRSSGGRSVLTSQRPPPPVPHAKKRGIDFKITPVENSFLRKNAETDHCPIDRATPQCSDEEKLLLAEFQTYLQHGLQTATVQANNSEKAFQYTLRTAMYWKAGERTPAPFVFPTLSAGGVKVSHKKIMYSVMFAVASILKKDFHLTHEQISVDEDLGNERKVDFSLRLVAEYIQRVLTSMYVVPIEVKARSTFASSFEHLHMKGVTQVVGHLARSLKTAFTFGGVGVDHKVCGVVFSLISIEILELELVNTGTKNAKLLFRRTGNYPLFNEETTRHLICLTNGTSSYEDIFGGKSGEDGFVILAGLMSSVGQNPPFFSEAILAVDGMDEEKVQLSFLGSGTFGDVFRLSEDTFLKVPKDPSFVSKLCDELNILSELHDTRIPGLCSEMLGLLKIQLRCEVASVPCLKLTGLVGQSASVFDFQNTEQVDCLCAEVMAALTCAHSAGIAHLDVRPSNIIVSSDTTNSERIQTETKISNLLRFQVIDWGCAAKFTETMTGFVGCIPYAHHKLLTRTAGASWRPTSSHDFASLAYTVATIMYRMECKTSSTPWHGFSRRDKVGAQVLLNRDAVTLGYLNKLGSEQATRLYYDGICCCGKENDNDSDENDDEEEEGRGRGR